jgi:hypothetical protein
VEPVIPAPVPVPLPAPVWLLQFLLVLTFLLHILAMNFLLGGGALLTVASFRGRRDARWKELAARISRAMPAVTAFTITLGVAPLLFLQLVYGQLFYTAAILMGYSWLGIVLLMLFGYYGFYWYALGREQLGPRAAWVALAATLLFVSISAVFTQQMHSMLLPQEFYSRWLAAGGHGVFGPWNAVIAARWLHFLLASAAIGGLGLAMLSSRWKDQPEMAGFAREVGVKWFLAATGLQFLGGFWFLLSLPPWIRDRFLGNDALSTSVLAAAILLAVVAMGVVRRSLPVGAAAIGLTVTLMAVVRHLVREAYLAPHFDPYAQPVRGQWVVFTLFALLLVAGIATVLWMLRQFAAAPAPGSARR